MNEIKLFDNTEFGELGIMVIDGKEYFPAIQCAKLLGYTNPRKAILDHCKEDGVTKRDVIDALGRTQQMKFINEGNLYRLIVSSKLPAAEKFERWIFDEVIPTIRKTGCYISTEVSETFSGTLAETLSVANQMLQTVQTLTQAVSTLEQRIQSIEDSLPINRQPNFFLWKKHVANPNLANLAEALNTDMRTAYDLVYDNMTTRYGFDRSFAIDRFCTRYGVENASVIDAIADVPLYQQQFIDTVKFVYGNIDVYEEVSGETLEEIIHPLVKKTNDRSANHIRTYGRIYNEMYPKDKWKELKKEHNCTGKGQIVKQNKELLSEFTEIVKMLLTENVSA